MKAKRSGLTIVEILVVVGIISLLVGLLLPAVNKVKNMAREAKQKVQLTAIQIGLATFKNDDGDFPPSDRFTWLEETAGPANSSGAQKLSEALLGWDLLGFHPDSGFRVDGMNRWDYSDGTTTHAAGTYWLYDRTINRELEKRRDRYIDIDTANVVRLGRTTNHDGLFDLSGDWGAAADTFVLGDVFGRGKDILLEGPDGLYGTNDDVRKKAGLPILYYRADTSGRTSRDIYNSGDNDLLVTIKEAADVARKGTPTTGLWNPMAGTVNVFYGLIRDTQASTMTSTGAFEVPRKPDTYILISAGADGLYGTSDDICNFQK